MTIERTRELLRGKVQHLTDEQVLLLIEQTNKSVDAIFTLSVKQAIAKRENKQVL